MRPQDRLAVIQRSVVREMARYGQRFTVDGEIVRGPGTTAVAVREHPGASGPGHVDLGFVLHLGRADGPVVWDCAAGLGKTEEEQLDNAVKMWATTTAAAVVEMLEHRGEHGDHYRHEALPGRLAVQGPAAVFGFDSERLAGWLADHQLLPALAGALHPELTTPGFNGVKLFLGGKAGDDIAEVRVNGEVSEAASAALRALSWPRGERLCWARLFILLVDERSPEAEPDTPTDVPAPVYSRTPRRGLLSRWWQALRAGQ
ncbi:hypothetical protein GCM10009760_55100 [Kitasatospora kazusensis]|uniref:Uncharacterized protein n=1 Tax=Kitasatospora kazusensis TaxID=407974 RepID=A0ABN3A700_9ACTN